LFDFLTDASIIFISLALFGFLIKDAFDWGKTVKPPNIYRGNIQTIFHFSSIATLILCWFVVWFVMLVAAPNQDNIITESAGFPLYLIQNFENNGLVAPGTHYSFIKLLTLAFFPSLFYIAAWTTTIHLGFISRYFSVNWIRMFFKENQYEDYPRIIAENDFLIYVEDNKNNQHWKAFRKSDIYKIEMVRHPSKWTALIRHYSELKRERKYRELVFEIFNTFYILIMTFVLIVPLIIS